jgi:hypothetical protein
MIIPAVIAALIFVPVVGVGVWKAGKKKQREQAHHNAHSPKFSNVYGGSRETPRKAARKGGWI